MLPDTFEFPGPPLLSIEGLDVQGCQAFFAGVGGHCSFSFKIRFAR